MLYQKDFSFFKKRQLNILLLVVLIFFGCIFRNTYHFEIAEIRNYSVFSLTKTSCETVILKPTISKWRMQAVIFCYDFGFINI
jgi:hypothetical protein